MRAVLTALLFIVASEASTLTPRTGWVFVPGAEDLNKSGLWSCSSGRPVLHPQGDFSVLGEFSAASSNGMFLALISQGRLDVGIANKSILVTLGRISHSFALPSSATDSISIEIAHIGSDIDIFVNGSQSGSLPDPGIFASGTVSLDFNVLAVAAAMPSGGGTVLAAPYLQIAKRTGSALRDIAGQKGFLIGAAVNPANFIDPGYAQALGREFNLIVPENAMKFAQTEPAPHQFSFCAADQIMAYAQANGIQVRGHNLVWHMNLPDWLANGHYSSSEASAILEQHINTVMGHFKGQLVNWDVVNEAIAYGAPYGPQPSYWLRQLGPNYVAMAFRWAHQADPQAKLFYNDTGGEGLGAKSDAVYNLVKGLVASGVPIHGVGLQMHLDLKSAPSQADISSNMARLAALGLEVQVTEMDVRLPVDSNDIASAADLASEAGIYQRVMAACRAEPKCTTFLTWGITDRYSWISHQYSGFGAGLLLDWNYQPKPAYDSLENALRH